MKKNWKRWGLRPVRIAGGFSFRATQLAALERRLIDNGEDFVEPARPAVVHVVADRRFRTALGPTLCI